MYDLHTCNFVESVVLVHEKMQNFLLSKTAETDLKMPLPPLPPRNPRYPQICCHAPYHPFIELLLSSLSLVVFRI